MKKILLILTCISISHFANAKTQNYILANGGGVDDNGLLLKIPKAKPFMHTAIKNAGHGLTMMKKQAGKF